MFTSLSAGERLTVLLELLGGPQYAAGMRKAAAETGLLGKTVDSTGKAMAVGSRRTWLMNQALYTFRRYAFYGTLAATAAAGAVIKLGYSYLSAMQTARVALSPVIKDQSLLNSYLAELFQISKYSPFVITDLAVAFRQLFAGLAGTGTSPEQILLTIKSLTDLMSFTGKTGPGALQKVSLALQHMAFAGRLTGYAVNQLSRDGIPIMRILNKQFGITGDQLHNISKMGIPASKVLAAINTFAKNTPGVNNAALRISMRTLPGLLQVVRDSLSQLSGAFIGSSYSGFQKFLFGIARQGGPLDRISAIGNTKGGGAATLAISRALTGNRGLGSGLLLLVTTVKNLGRVFIHVLVPAFVIALHSLIIFYPLLRLLNVVLGFLNKHATIAKYIFAALAAEFILTHSAILGMVLAQKLWTIATFGSIRNIRSMIKFVRLFREIQMVGMIARWKDLVFVQKRYIDGIGYKSQGFFAKFSRLLFTRVFPALTAVAAASWEFTLSLLANPITWIVVAVVALATALVILYFKWKRFHDLVDTTFSWITKHQLIVKAALYTMFGPIFQAAIALGFIIKHAHQIGNAIKQAPHKIHTAINLGTPLGFAGGGFTPYSGKFMVGEAGPELVHLPQGSRITPSQSVKSTLNMGGGGIGSSEHWQPIQVILDRKVIAQANARARQDKLARR